MEFKKYDIINGSGKVDSFGFDEIFSNDISSYKRLSDLNSKVGRELLESVFNFIGVEVDKNSLKYIASISSHVRKIIKDTDKEILEVIDSPNFLIPYTYLLSGFGFTISENNGKNGVNSHYALSKFIIESIKNNEINVSGFLCAHRENKEIKKHSLVENINLKDYQRVINLICGYFKNIGKDPNITFYHLRGDENGLNSAFPNIFINYLKKGELYKMSLLLDNHFEQIKKYSDVYKIKIKPASEHYKSTIRFLKEKYGENVKNISYDELYDLAEEQNDKIAEIAYYMTYDDVKRIQHSLDEFKKSNKDEILKLSKINIENAKKFGKEEVVKKAIDIFLGSDNLVYKSLYETVFYYLWGEKTRKQNGLALGFDRDHDLFQTEAFAYGYKPDIMKSMVPLLYARRTGKKSINKINELSFRQFWHFYE